jgi:hypothetical protein
METYRVQIPGPVYSCKKEATNKWRQRNKYKKKKNNNKKERKEKEKRNKSGTSVYDFKRSGNTLTLFK